MSIPSLARDVYALARNKSASTSHEDIRASIERAIAAALWVTNDTWWTWTIEV